MVQSLFPTSNEKAPSFWNLRRTHAQLILCLVNVIPKTIVWWAGAGMIVGFFASVTISFQRRLGRWGGKVKTSTFEKNVWEEEIYEAMLAEDDSFSDSTVTGESSTTFKEKKSSLSATWKVMAYVLPTLLFVLLILVGCNQYHTFREDIPNDVISQTIEPQTPYLLTLVLMTAPRKRGATYIKETLSSYLANFPDEEVDSLYSRIQIVVYTHFTDFPGYDDAKAYFDTIPKARKHVKWVRDEGSEKNQRKHLVSAIRKIGTVDESVYLGVMEDDFPFCEDGWQEMLNTIYRAHTEVKDHCGVFVGTGGSGLIFKRSVALTASFILESDVQTAALGLTAPPPDISLQDCLMGKHEFCSSCAGTLVTSRTLLQRHLGYNSSTSGDGYDKNQFQCGWRQPFVSSSLLVFLSFFYIFFVVVNRMLTIALSFCIFNRTACLMYIPSKFLYSTQGKPLSYLTPTLRLWTQIVRSLPFSFFYCLLFPYLILLSFSYFAFLVFICFSCFSILLFLHIIIPILLQLPLDTLSHD